ncbi:MULTISPECIES: metal ABC transporter ATP-binding protein [unclassified Nitratiruptor]|uniref:metal ABC transporter ATP-binding protein n=1 Tax=unclassified Nitratiruptor TaxID=2624044 RepID=UPI0019154312|nr:MULTISPECIES: ABC transporter ATP-binding protein [unclassified Nitratiruptor]BCD59681.1 hypothetical protein NitYY0810_C0433 [Nitratiruptor sp. YY08-10]BCD63605.1 zinc transport system ATP-binding protein [Nitratiruptor sp. YY08-14]
MRKAIEIEHLWFRYQNEYVLEDITVSIEENEYIAIIGPNGGGKTTLVKLILGLLQPTKGSVHIFGQPPQKVSSLIGYLPQHINFNLDIPLLAKEVILQGRLQANRLRFDQKDYEALGNVTRKLGIEHIIEKKISQLSGGQRQRVLLARAIISDPKILILDEPTASVDLQSQKEIYHLLKNLNLTRIVVSHDINILLEGVQRVLYVNRKLYEHTNIPLNIDKKDGHFCEMELLEELYRSCNG